MWTTDCGQGETHARPPGQPLVARPPVPVRAGAHHFAHAARPLRDLELEFDFHAHRLLVRCAHGGERSVALAPRSVADFHAEVMARLEEIGHAVRIHTRPNEVAEAIPFGSDRVHDSYDTEAVGRFWTALRLAEGVLQEFRPTSTRRCASSCFRGRWREPVRTRSGPCSTSPRAARRRSPSWVGGRSRDGAWWRGGWGRNRSTPRGRTS